ncbi:ATP-dependent RNA helicase DHX33-like isoform X1 [Vespa velutina]|uniref:ATP-dependent RNA helicase DHX33-like isoform X1 n=1 Tax=Vespa velutina TaxID=202808 RepID=UPI001FB1B093|nr:ATP-dependent RNA helicase DHX33-like isoform X1 [Vespa velutina]XP_047365184.1 ATP-dependent RNA helicase DHX33-like isoform X1 [Vespa velutina]
MGVHDNADSKYNVMGTSSFSKLAPKRPNTVVFGESPAKVQKHEESSGSSFSNVENTTEPGSTSVHQQRKSLPVYRLRKRLLEEIRRYSTLIIIGETGSGKTTQIPQLLLSSGIAGVSGRVGVTQPRRVAAVSIARRVAQEQGVETGKLVGYCVRFEDVTSPQTRIKYLTDGMMVREAMTDEILSDYSVVILDEAHERSVQTDVLLGVTKRAQNLRKLKNLPPLKLLVMSATIDADKFAKYFHAPVLYLEGRQHPVKIYHAVKSQEDYVFSSMVTAFQIHRETPANEDILVFLTGQEEIETAVVNAKQVAKQLDGKGYPPLKVFPLYSALPTHQQLEAFKPAPTGMRKLIFSTNVAETSVTIGGIRHVIDTGVVKARTHHPTTGLDVLKVEQISKAQAWQRTGRAAREAPGKCYRTYTKDEFERMKEMPVPEIQRCSLAGVALQLLAIGVDITSFDFMERPPKEAVDVAVTCLEKLAAVKGSPPQLTTLGRTMSLFPLDPRFTKVILASVEHRCLEEALTVVALLSGESIFTDPPAKRQQAYAAKSRFASPEGDHVTLLNVFRGYTSTGSQKKVWCHENFLHHRNLEYATEVRKQLATLAERANLDKASCGTNTEQLRKALLEGLYENLAELQRDNNTYVTVSSKQPVAIHPSSTLHGTKPSLILFTEIVATGKCYLRDLSVIENSWLSEKGVVAIKHE